MFQIRKGWALQLWWPPPNPSLSHGVRLWGACTCPEGQGAVASSQVQPTEALTVISPFSHATHSWPYEGHKQWSAYISHCPPSRTSKERKISFFPSSSVPETFIEPLLCVRNKNTGSNKRTKKKNPWHSSHTIPPTEYPPRESRDQSIKSLGKPWITHLIDPQSILPHITVKSSEYFKAFMNIFLIDTLTTRLGAPVWLSSYEAALQNSLLPLTSSPPPRRQTLQMDQLSLRQMRYIKQMSVLTKVPTENLGLSGAQAAHWARGCCNNWADS